MNINIRAIDQSVAPGIRMPAYHGDAGLDLLAVEDCVIPAHGMLDVRHGFAIEIPPGYFGYVLPRSSTITRNQGSLVVMASPIDSGYRGQIFSMVRNNSDEDIHIYRGERISQMVILPHAAVESLEFVSELSPSERSTLGFGSTGK